MDFKDWKFIKNNNIKEIRKKYRDYVAEKTLDFINNDYSSIVVTEIVDDDDDKRYINKLETKNIELE